MRSEEMHCNACNMNKNCNKSSNGEERTCSCTRGMMIYRKAQRSARNLYSLAVHLSLRPLKRERTASRGGESPCELVLFLASDVLKRATTSCDRDASPSPQARARALSWPFARAGDLGPWHHARDDARPLAIRRRIGARLRRGAFSLPIAPSSCEEDGR